jgi:hypothetical protein
MSSVPEVEGSVNESTNGVHHDNDLALPAPPARAIQPLRSAPASVVAQPDPGLYAILGLDPSASDADIQTTYRRRAAQLTARGSRDKHALRQLNVAYEVLGNPFRRADYDRLRTTAAGQQPHADEVRRAAKVAAPITRRRRPRHAVQPRYAGLGDVFVVLMVVGLAVSAGLLIVPRLSINLSALNALSTIMPGTARRAVDSPPAGSATPGLPTTVDPRFSASSVSVSNPNPPRDSAQNVVVKLRRDGQPAANVEVWASVAYYSTRERWPSTGTVKTDATGSATISFNVGGATPDFPVEVRAYALVDDQPALAGSASFTPR